LLAVGNNFPFFSLSIISSIGGKVYSFFSFILEINFFLKLPDPTQVLYQVKERMSSFFSLIFRNKFFLKTPSPYSTQVLSQI